MKKHLIMKITAVFSVIALAVSMATVGFAAKSAAIYLAVSENKTTGAKYADVYLSAGKTVSSAEISFSAGENTSISGCFGSIMAPVSSKASHTDESASLTLSLSGSYDASALVYAGRMVLKTNSSFSGEYEDLVKLDKYVADSETEKCALKIVDALNFDPDSIYNGETTSASAADEPSSNTDRDENESSSAAVTEPTSASVTEPTSDPSKPVTPEKVVSANVEFYVYSDFNNNAYAAVRLDLGNVKSMIVSVSADSTKFRLGEEAVMFDTDKVNSNVVIDSESNSVIITAMTGEKYVDSYVAYIPLTLGDNVSIYDDFSSSFSADTAIINGKRANVNVQTLSTTYTPEKYGENWFRGFDATYNRYGDGENMKEEYLFYAVGAGFANDYEIDLKFQPGVKVVRASSIDESGTCEISTDSDGVTTVMLRVNSAMEKKLDYRKVISVIVKTEDENVSYKNIWSFVTVAKFITNGIEQKFDNFKNVSYLGNWEHYDTVNGVNYVSYDFGEKTGYTAVASYEDSTKDKDVVVRDCVREGYTVAQINKYAFRDCLAKSIALPDTIEIISEGAFMGCKNITEFTMTPSVYAVKERAFEGCESLVRVNYNNALALEGIGSYAFLNCKEYKTIELPAGEYALGKYSYGYITDSNSNIIKNDGVKFICVSGSPAKDYAIDNGFAYEGVGEAKFDIINVSGIKLLYDNANGYVIVDAGLTVGDLTSVLNKLGAVGVTDSESNDIADSSAAVATGMKFKMSEKNKYLDIAVRGDADSNAAVNILDARLILRIASKLENCENMTAVASDVDFDSKITAKDARAVLRVAAKLDSFS